MSYGSHLSQLTCGKMSFRSSVNGDEDGIDAGGLKLEAGTPKCTKESSSFELRKTGFITSIEPY